MRWIVTWAFLGSLALAGTGVGGDPFERRTLSNGVELAVLRVPDAPTEAVFTFLPLGLYDDPPGAAQQAHLLEHMLIRSTDPDGLEVDGIRINGETTGDLLRLETLAPAERWREALARHPRWLAARAFDAEVLEREQGRIAGEEATTVARGATAKWAQVAWSQVVRGGLDVARVHGDVVDADVEAVAAAARERVRAGPGVRVVCSGPVGLDELAAALEQGFAEHAAEAAESTAAAPGRDPAEPFRPGLREARWDLDAAHYLEWYALPDGGPGDAAFALLLEHRALMALMSSVDPLLGSGQALADTRLRAAGRRALMLSVSLAPDADVEALQTAVADALAPLRDPRAARASLEQVRTQLAFQLGGLPDFGALRKRLQGQPTVDFVEAQTALSLAATELATGLTLPELRAALSELDLEARCAALAAALAPERRCALLLTP